MGKWVHRLSNVDPATQRGDCAECGVGIRLKKRNRPGKVAWACYASCERKKVRRAEMREELLIAQGDLCAICQTSLTFMRTQQVHLDHDHRTGHVRGVLCHGCNTGIGLFRDSPHVLLAAARYLEQEPSSFR